MPRQLLPWTANRSREVVQNEQNGLLVPNYDVDALAKAMKRMVDDEVLYARCKANAAASVKFLSLESIAKKWSAILPKPL
jgi:glycosyltransferase involved in cell wall biosynthesis